MISLRAVTETRDKEAHSLLLNSIMQIRQLSLTLILLMTISSAESLFDVFTEAGPGYGYDKYVILNPDITYQGGVGVYEGDVFIEGNGAVVDLEGGGGIWVFGDESSMASLIIDHCSVINGGAYGINYSGLATGVIQNCNILGSDMGIQLMDETEVEINNCNIGGNVTYGLAIYSTLPVAVINYCNTWENGEDYMENCPG